ncbi:MAG: aldehyde dehydrogenase family protein [Alphaproteobacteria bacterium]
MDIAPLLAALHLPNEAATTGGLSVTTPIDGSIIGAVEEDDAEGVDRKIERAQDAFRTWREVPAPRRGELIRLFADELREHKAALGALVTVEAGKIAEEGCGEVQEMIDICDFALGLSRQLYGLTIASERPGHALRETWHPLGPVGVISAFNFPVAVWSWNFALAIVCGDPVIWKPSDKTPLSAIACQTLFMRAAARFDGAPPDLSQVVFGGREVGQQLAADPRLPLISATGSCRMGRELAPTVAGRFGRALLELGGNNAMIVAPSADLDLAVRAIVFSAAGTAGQRCTSLRRLIVHEDLYDRLIPRLKAAYDQLRVGDPRQPETLVGPLIDGGAFGRMEDALDRVRGEGGLVHGGTRVEVSGFPDGYYVRPALVELPDQTDTVREETFAPILYAIKYSTLDDAIVMHNEVPQGLSSCIFTNDLREAERFVSATGSDCGIANVNVGPSGAEIGGAFGGEKETGGGRESGTDSWRSYMRRQTNTINYSKDLPLAQGINFQLTG